MNEPIQALCGNCALWARLRGDEERGMCLRYPPRPVAVPVVKTDLMRGQAVQEWTVQAHRPITAAPEACGEFRPNMQPQSAH